MAWTELETDWRSLVAEYQLDSARPPFNFQTPAIAWDYGAISDPLPQSAVGRVLRLRLRASGGGIGVALTKPNGSSMLSREAVVTPEDGDAVLLFEVVDGYGSSSILVRNSGAPGAGGTLLQADWTSMAELDAETRAKVLGPASSSARYRGPDLASSNVAYRDEPLRPIALGNTCEAKIQIARVLQFQRWPQTSQAAFRLQMLPPKRSKALFGWDLFDWQGTSIPALISYLENDFHGFYEREDLEAKGGGVVHRQWGTEHFHDFEALTSKEEPLITEAMIDRNFAAGRAWFEDLAEQFREHLMQPGPFLYVHVCEDIPNEVMTRLLMQQLAARSPDHRFHLLYVGFEDEDNDLSSLSDQVTKAYRPRPADGPSMAVWGNTLPWQGDYAAWDKALGPFDLRLPAESLDPR